MAAAALAQSLGQQATLLAGLDYFWMVSVIGLIGLAVMLTQRVLKKAESACQQAGADVRKENQEQRE